MEQPITTLNTQTMKFMDKLFVYLIVFVGVTTVAIFQHYIKQPISLWITLISGIGSFIPMTLLHEGLHGLGFWKFTGRAKFGVKLHSGIGIVFYATSPNAKVTHSQMNIIALLPQLLTLVSFFAFLILSQVNSYLAYGLLCMAGLNLAGGGADIWVVIKMLNQPKTNIYQDTITGVSVWHKD